VRLRGKFVTFNARRLLGGSLAGQEKYVEAEPLPISGYEGMQAQIETMRPQGRLRLKEAGERILGLYEAWRRPDKLEQWRARVAKDSAL